MVEDIFDAKKFERQGNQKNIVGGIATLNDLKTVPQINPPGVHELPKESVEVFNEMPEGTIAFRGGGVPVDMNTIEELVPSLVPFAARGQW